MRFIGPPRTSASLHHSRPKSTRSAGLVWPWWVSAGHCHWYHRRLCRRCRQWRRRGGRGLGGDGASLDGLRMKRKMMMVARTGHSRRFIIPDRNQQAPQQDDDRGPGGWRSFLACSRQRSSSAGGSGGHDTGILGRDGLRRNRSKMDRPGSEREPGRPDPTPADWFVTGLGQGARRRRGRSVAEGGDKQELGAWRCADDGLADRDWPTDRPSCSPSLWMNRCVCMPVVYQPTAIASSHGLASRAQLATQTRRFFYYLR